MVLEHRIEVLYFPRVYENFCKFIQVQLDGMDYIIFPPRNERGRVEQTIHAKLLADFLKKNNINYEKRKDDKPLPSGERYTMVGAGSLKISDAYHESKGVKEWLLDFRESNPSMDYNMNLDDDQLNRLSQEHPEWELKI